ncbi:MAG TPA: tetratricopeptide repeat protein [Dongiaceae bacterium]|nr:tetratricopeptide repeat protein [Dongiaceae bacterium]
MTRQQLCTGLVAGLFAIALPIAAALAAGGGGGGSSGGGSGGGSGGSGGGSGGSGGGSSSGLNGAEEIGSLTIPGDDALNAEYKKAQDAINAANYSTAIDLLQKVLARQPENPDVLNLIGFSERKSGEASQALNYYKKALGLQPTHIGANEYLGELYLELKEPELAEERLAVLQQVCGSCREFTELKEKIEKYKANAG